MTHTVIGLFDSDFDAQEAVDSLMTDGFDRQNIDIKKQQNVTGERDVEIKHTNEKKENGITRFFKNLFGTDDEGSDKYTTVALKSGAIVTVHTATEEEAARVADILDDKGAVDVDEKAVAYGYTNRVVNDNYATSPSTNIVNDRPDNNYNSSTPNANRQQEKREDLLSEEDAEETTRREVSSGPGTGAMPTEGKRSRARVFEYRGEAAAQLREDRDSETKFW